LHLFSRYAEPFDQLVNVHISKVLERRPLRRKATLRQLKRDGNRRSPTPPRARPPLTDKGRRNIQPQDLELAAPTDLFQKRS